MKGRPIKINPNMCKMMPIKKSVNWTQRDYLKNQKEWNNGIDVENFIKKIEEYRKNFFEKNLKQDIGFHFNLIKGKKDNNFEEFKNFIALYINDENKDVIKIFLEKENQHWESSYLNAGIIHYEWQKWSKICKDYYSDK